MISSLIEGFLLACLKYFCPVIYRCVHTPSTIQEAHTDPKLAKKYGDAFTKWQAEKDAKDNEHRQ